MEVDGVKIFFTHGHAYQVGYGLEELEQTARDLGASIACYGHTHVRLEEYAKDFTFLIPAAWGEAAWEKIVTGCWSSATPASSPGSVICKGDFVMTPTPALAALPFFPPASVGSDGFFLLLWKHQRGGQCRRHPGSAWGKRPAASAILRPLKHRGTPCPQPGDYAVITDFAGNGICIIQILWVEELTLPQAYPVYQRMDRMEESPQQWLAQKQAQQQQVCRELDLPWQEDMPVLLESFRVVFKVKRVKVKQG